MSTIKNFALLSACVVWTFAALPLSHGADSSRPQKRAAPQGAPTSSATPAASAASSKVTVDIPKDAMGKGAAAYGASPLLVKPGTEVTWKNSDTVAHTATADDGSWDSGFIMPGKTYSRVFDRPGKYPYYCTLHGKQTMSGSIEVK